MLKGWCVRLALCSAFALGASRAASQDSWPQFRGPGSSGVVESGTLPESWSASESVLWKVPVPGRGWSSPIAWGDRIYLTTAVSEGDEEAAQKGLYLGGDRRKPSGNRHRWLVLCLDLATGKTLWEREAHAGVPSRPRHIKNSHASETPCTDGERVYAQFGSIGLFAYDRDGKPLWSRRWEARRMKSDWGTASSPVVHGGKVIVVQDNEESSSIEALDGKSGETVWRTPRDEKSNWSTPLIWKTPDRTEVVTAGTRRVRSYGLDGKLLWELGGMSSITIPTPVAGDGLVYVSSGFILDLKKPIYAIRPGASGDLSLKDGEDGSASIAWRLKRAAPYNPSPVLYRGQLYVLLDLGLLASYDAKSGKALYEAQRIAPDAGSFTASPWAAGGKVFCLSEDGDTYAIEAGPALKVVRKNGLGEMCLATPAAARGSLLIRSASSLYRIGEKGK